MSAETIKFAFKTKGNTQVIDITPQVAQNLAKAKIKDGLVTIFVPGATGGLTTLEFEPGLVKDLQEAWERLVPRSIDYAHHLAYDDGNGHSHVRASLLGPSLSVPLVHGELLLGTYQQIIFVDFDVRPRSREIILQVVG